MIEQTLTYRGQYFVLDGAALAAGRHRPREIHLDRLLARADPALGGPVSEVIVATNFSSEGEATAHYVGEMLKARGLKVTRTARGVPVGGELESRRCRHHRAGGDGPPHTVARSMPMPSHPPAPAQRAPA